MQHLGILGLGRAKAGRQQQGRQKRRTAQALNILSSRDAPMSGRFYETGRNFRLRNVFDFFRSRHDRNRKSVNFKFSAYCPKIKVDSKNFNVTIYPEKPPDPVSGANGKN